jgi:hypothetical protein
MVRATCMNACLSEQPIAFCSNYPTIPWKAVQTKLATKPQIHSELPARFEHARDLHQRIGSLLKSKCIASLNRLARANALNVGGNAAGDPRCHLKK